MSVETSPENNAALTALEDALRAHWRLGQNIVLCWSALPEGIGALLVPHGYLGHFAASLSDVEPTDRLDQLNGRFIRRLIAGRRQLVLEDFFGTARRLELEPIVLPSVLNSAAPAAALEAVERLIKRYSISYVESRAALLFDIVDFSLYAPFEQTSQLNSLSYSLNAALHALLENGVVADIARTTTGDGFYVWNRESAPRANVDLFHFMLLAMADNAIARRRAGARAPTVPLLRAAFHIGSHFEFYQVEGINPALHSYIVGEVTIELARMVDIAHPGQIFIGDFNTAIPTSPREGAFLVDVDSQRFVERSARQLRDLRNLELSGAVIDALHCQLTGATGASAGQSVRRFRITDKHGRSRHAYNLRINVHTGDGHAPLLLGLHSHSLPKPGARGQGSVDAQRSPRRRLYQPRLLSED